MLGGHSEKTEMRCSILGTLAPGAGPG
jgi:hypothetical protein